MSFKGLLTGLSGVQANTKKMQVVGNNIANLSTAGFNQDRVTFHETYHEVLKSASAGDGGNTGGTNPATIGSGTAISAITTIHSQGGREQTGRTLDFMIEGDDFFVARNAGNDQIMLTRAGSFELDGDMFLTDSMGNKVVGFNVDPLTGTQSSTAEAIQLTNEALPPRATTQVFMESNIDSSVSETAADLNTNGWDLFSAGENFGGMNVSLLGSNGTRTAYGSGFYTDGMIYEDRTATVNAALDTVTLSGASGLAEGFGVGDVVSLLQGSTQIQRSVSAVNTTTGEVTLNGALPASFAAGAIEMTNISNAEAAMGSSNGEIHNDILRSQIAMVNADGEILASFYRVDDQPANYTRATAETDTGDLVTLGVAEFSNMQDLKEAMELALRDTNLTHHASSVDLDITLDNYGKMAFSGSGLVEEFRLVMNAENTEMIDRFDGIAITDNAATATTQARINAAGEIISAPSLGLPARTVNSSKNWFDTSGVESFGYSATNPSTEYGEYAGLRMANAADGSGFGILQLNLTNALGQEVTQEFRMVPRDPDANQYEFTTMGELAKLMQNTLRSTNFSSLAEDGTLVNDDSVRVTFTEGRLAVSTTEGVFRDLQVTALNTSSTDLTGIERTDEMNFGSVLGQLSEGVNGKAAFSNKFIKADISSQTTVFDSQGNEHTLVTSFVRDRSSGLNNIEWKFKNMLNPNISTFAQENPEQNAIYGNTFNSIFDSTGSRGVLAFDIETGEVLGSNAPDSDSRYIDEANITFTAQINSQEADTSIVNLDFSRLTSYNGRNTVIGRNSDGYPMGNLVRITTESNTGNINGVYSNGKIQTLAKVGLMSITNPEGLQKIGTSYYVQSTNSSEGGLPKGLDQVFAVGDQDFVSGDSVQSKVHGMALEQSNVDLSEQFVQMIQTQRAFSASGRSITTNNDMIQEVLQWIR